MRYNHVKVFYTHCAEQRIGLPPEESYITFARSYEVNGVHIREDWAELRFTPFGELHLRTPDEDAIPDFRLPYQAFLDSLTPEDILDTDSSSEFVAVIPVSTIEFIDGFWMDHKTKNHLTAVS